MPSKQVGQCPVSRWPMPSKQWPMSSKRWPMPSKPSRFKPHMKERLRVQGPGFRVQGLGFGV